MTQDEQFRQAFLALEPSFKQALLAIGSGEHAVTAELMKIDGTLPDGSIRRVGIHMILCIDTTAAVLRGALGGVNEAREIEAGAKSSAVLRPSLIV